MIRIIVATHKEYAIPEDRLYLPVQAGAACHESLRFTRDDVGDNISSRNGQYCELTALYWGWRNLKMDALGLCHYRRYFQEPGKNKPLTGTTAEQLMKDVPVILPKKRNYFIESGEGQFIHAHGEESLDALRETMSDLYPRYVAAFDWCMKRTYGHRFNMMIMDRKQMDSYCAWLFDILFETERRMGTPPPRMMGFLAERMVDAWIETRKIPYRELAVYQTEKTNWVKKGGAFLGRKIRGGPR